MTLIRAARATLWDAARASCCSRDAGAALRCVALRCVVRGCCCVGCVARTVAADFARLLLLLGLWLLVAVAAWATAAGCCGLKR